MADISNIRDLALKLNLYNIAKGKVDLKIKFKNNLDYIEDIFLQELEYRKKNKLKLLKKKSNLPTLKYDYKNINDGLKWQIKELKKLKFLENDENIIVVGSCGKGKTSLSVDIATEAINDGRAVIYHTIDTFLKIVKGKTLEDKYKEEYKNLKNAELIIIDEFLYLNINNDDLELLYKSLMFFNESRSLIIISNRKIQNFVDAASDKHLMATLTDRIKANSHIISL